MDDDLFLGDSSTNQQQQQEDSITSQQIVNERERSTSQLSNNSNEPKHHQVTAETEISKQWKAKLQARVAEVDKVNEGLKKQLFKHGEEKFNKMIQDRKAKILQNQKKNRQEQQEFIAQMKKPLITHLADLEKQTEDRERMRLLLKASIKAG